MAILKTFLLGACNDQNLKKLKYYLDPKLKSTIGLGA